MNSVEDLDVFKLAHQSTIKIYAVTKTFPKDGYDRVIQMLSRLSQSIGDARHAPGSWPTPPRTRVTKHDHGLYPLSFPPYPSPAPHEHESRSLFDHDHDPYPFPRPHDPRPRSRLCPDTFTAFPKPPAPTTTITKHEHELAQPPAPRPPQILENRPILD